MFCHGINLAKQMIAHLTITFKHVCVCVCLFFFLRIERTPYIFIWIVVLTISKIHEWVTGIEKYYMIEYYKRTLVLRSFYCKLSFKSLSLCLFLFGILHWKWSIYFQVWHYGILECLEDACESKFEGQEVSLHVDAERRDFNSRYIYI